MLVKIILSSDCFLDYILYCGNKMENTLNILLDIPFFVA